MTRGKVQRLPRTLQNLARNPRDRAMVLARFGSSRHCANCGSRFGRFVPHPAVISEFLERAGYNTGTFREHQCPVCGIGDRERHLLLYFDATDLWSSFAGARVLHFAPEWSLRPRVEPLASRYVAADLLPADDRTIRMDLMAIDAPDATFDVVICNHVLEHVPDPDVALSEISRVLRVGGIALLQTPFASRLGLTFEDPLIESESDRVFFYGQDDHARLFGLDLFQRIEGAGFSVGPIGHDDVLGSVDPRVEGVSEAEPLILATKSADPVSPSTR